MNYFKLTGNKDVMNIIGKYHEGKHKHIHRTKYMKVLHSINKKYSDKEVADLIKVQVHSGTTCKKKWEKKISLAIISGKTDKKQIWDVCRNPYTYIGGRWLFHHLQDFFWEKYPQYN